MQIKCLLLGSAAVVIAVSSAQAADAVVVEPEPIEYVRICDAYGTGWFYIPGTETCLKIDGDVRAEYGVKKYHDEQEDETSAHESRYRARVNFRANNETEYGTLQSRIRFQAQYKDPKTTGAGGSHNDEISVAEGPGTSNSVTIDHATISLAGFYIGFFDNFWKRAGHDGWYVSLSRFEGPYGDYDALFAEYTFGSNGLNVTVGMEDGSVSGEAGAPDPYAGITYTNGGLYLAGIAYYDGSTEAAAYKGRFDYDFGEAWSGFQFGGWYMWDDGKTDYVKGHAMGLTAQVDLAPRWTLFGGYGLYDNMYADTANSCTGEDCASELNNSGMQWKVGLQWEVVPSLYVIPEYQGTVYDEETDSQQNYGFANFRVVRTF
jgi:hypothetical protein